MPAYLALRLDTHLIIYSTLVYTYLLSFHYALSIVSLLSN